MSLSRKFVWFNLSLLAMVAALGTLAIWNVFTVWRVTQVSTSDYAVMDRASAVSNQVSWLQTNLRADARKYRDLRYFTPIQDQVGQMMENISTSIHLDDGDGAAIQRLAKAVVDHLSQAQSEAGAHPNGPVEGKSDVVLAELEQVQTTLDALAKLAPESARRHITLASAVLPGRLLWLCGWLLLVLIVSTIIHFRQYQALVRPLISLRDGMRQSKIRDYRAPVESLGDAEFREMAAYFNGLAKDLADLYRDLEDKVIARSRELVRSERLASVGFLAAGVAHEINNPLSIISGYAELASRDIERLLSGPDAAADLSPAEAQAEKEATMLAHVLDAQAIIQQEAFRCKEITTRLLSLARGGQDGRQLVSIAETARMVATLTKGLKNYRNCKIYAEFDSDPLHVCANPTEMKQVMLNLAVNALEAAAGNGGEVKLSGRRSSGMVELLVEDTGKGMTPEMLQHIFEPFFTAKRGSNESGTGLGLSITHAIIENHGGRIRAESDGPGRGSRFIVSLPSKVNAHEPADTHCVSAGAVN